MTDIRIKYQKLTFPVEEAYKSLRTNLFFCGRDKKVIAITSCTPNEGKSTVSLNLALSLAEAHKKVILIDGDLRNSTLLGKIHLAGDKEKDGLAYYLSGMTSFEDLICTTDHEGLDMILTGGFPPNPAELLGESSFKELLEKLRASYDYVIVDTPPVGNVIDSAIIAESCDGLVMVIESNAISYRFAQRVKEQLEKTSCPILGVILNKIDPTAQGYGRYGSYGKYGRYGQYGRYGRYGKAVTDETEKTEE
ncbi:MAG: polysaccharide biosynthesis tyrosine autokinase [Oscillospiraceae bacterium]|nr:polysaccharide biosynthesis tyrosine autokinase [Oscillospiraceae bacterium]